MFAAKSKRSLLPTVRYAWGAVFVGACASERSEGFGLQPVHAHLQNCSVELWNST